MRVHKYYLGVFGVIFAGLCYATMGAIVKVITNAALAPSFPMIIFIESAVACFLIYLVNSRNPAAIIKTARLGWHFLRAIFGLSMVVFAWISIKYLSVADAVLLHNTAPLFIPLLSLVLFRKKIHPLMWFLIIVGLSGVYLIDDPGKGIITLPALFGLISGFSFALVLMVSAKLTKTEPISRILFYYFLLSTLISGVVAIFNWQATTLVNYGFMVTLGLLFCVLQASLNLGVKYTSALINSILFYSCVIFGVMFDYYIWHLSLNYLSVSGILLIALCCIFVLWIGKNPHPEMRKI